MPYRFRLAAAAEKVYAEATEDLKPAAQALMEELRAMERQRCVLCDGRGHTHTSSGGVSRRAEACPVRRIL